MGDAKPCDRRAFDRTFKNWCDSNSNNNDRMMIRDKVTRRQNAHSTMPWTYSVAFGMIFTTKVAMVSGIFYYGS